MNLRAIIVDDEPLAREGIRSFLTQEQDIAVVAECGDGAEALEKVEQLKPDLLFLDIQMPRLNGFQVLEALGANAPRAIIFTTAHDQHAIRAFEVNAIDYLLKPFKQDRLQKAVQRAREQVHAASPNDDNLQITGLLQHLREKSGPVPRILVRSPDRILFLRPAEIDYVEAAGNYLVLHVGKERHTIRDTMTAMESRLARAGFMRVSRSVILNLARVRELQPVAAGAYSVLLQNGVRLGMTCGLREFQERLGNL